MIKIPKAFKLPGKEDLEYREKEFMVDLREQIEATSKYWFIALAALIILFIPFKYGLEILLTNQLIASIEPVQINTNPFDPEELEIVRAEAVQVRAGEYSVYAQVLNPNFDLSAWDLDYAFIFKDSTGEPINESSGSSFILAGESRFFVQPSVELTSVPAEVGIEFENIRWTTRTPEFDLNLAVVQQDSGVTSEGNQYVQAVVKNQLGFHIKKVRVNVLVFAKEGGEIIAVNSTEFSDLEPFEGRFFRVLWPGELQGAGNIEVMPVVNPLEPGIIFEAGNGVPVR